MHRPVPSRTGRWLLGQVLARLGVDHELLQLGAQPFAQRLRRAFVAAAPGHQDLDLLLDAVLPQARRALVEVVADQVAPRVVAFEVEVEVDLREYALAVHLVRLPTAHDFHTSWPAGASTGRSDPPRSSPRSAA